MKWKGKINMVAKKKYFTILASLAILLTVGLWNTQKGNPVFGASLIVASLGFGILRIAKERRIAKLKAKGLNPHDERTMHIVGQASVLTINVTILLIGVIILGGSVIGPEIMVNLYDLLGFCLAGIVLIYMTAYYYYSRLN